MIELLDSILPYIQGLNTLPWILVGFIVTAILSKFFGEEKINKIMRKIGLILLYIFIPLLLFRIFLGVDFSGNEILFTIACFLIFSLMYSIAYIYAKSKTAKLINSEKSNFIKTVLTNQGRSSAFIGGTMLAIPEWRVQAAIYMSVGAIFLFAFIPYILSYLHKKEINKEESSLKIKALPWYLKLYPWFLLILAFAAIILHVKMGLTTNDFGINGNTIFTFFTQLTIPAALYYVGAGIHPNDLKIQELKKLFSIKHETKDHWPLVRNIFFLTVVITPIVTIIIFGILLAIKIIPNNWFAVIFINSILPITSTNMFLIPYGIDKKVTALSVTWTTIFCVPIVVALIFMFSILFV